MDIRPVGGPSFFHSEEKAANHLSAKVYAIAIPFLHTSSKRPGEMRRAIRAVHEDRVATEKHLISLIFNRLHS